ncbi:MAG TPA: hypothetical protein VE087_06865, partial [Xanthobacteraceae bacterium]|nr:hypothetical protein [Xanthobacteraceae bacterium]
MIECLIEKLRHCFPETAGERIARHRIEIADPFQTDPPQTLGGERIEAEGLYRQRGQGGASIPWRENGDTLACFRKTGHCPGGAERVGNGDAAGDTLAVEPGHKIVGERPFPAPEM